MNAHKHFPRPAFHMAEDLFHGTSPSKLRDLIAQKVIDDQRSLPPRAKIFSAVAQLQGYDQWPGIQPPPEIDKLVASGYTELNRGLSGTKGVPALFYARELVKGRMYPGTLSAFGTGIHLSTTSEHKAGYEWNPRPEFPRVSNTACKYACGNGDSNDSGILLRCVLKPEAKLLSHEQIKDIRRENLNRAREANLTDFGSLAAALGFDGFICDKLDVNQEESWYVIVNRTALIFQNIVIQHSHERHKK